MNKYFQDSAFKLGFSIGILISIFVNYSSYVVSLHKYDTRPIKLSAGYYGGGFPFHFYQVHIGNPGYIHFDWGVLFIDILVLLTLSFIFGLILKFIWSKITARKARSGLMLLVFRMTDWVKK